MNCPMETGENAGLLLDFAAGKLKADVRAQMERHLETCPACSEFAGRQKGTSSGGRRKETGWDGDWC